MFIPLASFDHKKMTTQLTSSPFASEIGAGAMPSAPPIVQDDFSIRTMQADLKELSGGGIIKKEEKLPPKIKPAAALPPAQQIKPLSQVAPSPPKENSFFSKPAEPAKNIVEVPAAITPSSPNKQSSSVKIILAIIVILIISIVGLGMYYFLIAKNSKPAAVTAIQAPTETSPTQPQPVETPVAAMPQPEKYSQDKPNFLSLDVNTMSSDEIKTAITKVAADLKTTETKSPYEFIVVDANNNPVAFPIFAIAAKLNLSPALLSALGENFSLFVFNDNGNVRLGLSATIVKADVAATEIQKQEKTLPADISFMFLDESPDQTVASFKDGSYNDAPTRYLNLNAQETLSIDYALSSNNLIIGTSENTEHAIMDKLSQQSASAATASTTSSTPIAPQAPAATAPIVAAPQPQAPSANDSSAAVQ